MSLARTIELGAQRDPRARLRIAPSNDTANTAAQVAALARMSEAQRLTGLTAVQLDAHQARLRREREQRELQRARCCQCPSEMVANDGINCGRCGGRIVHEAVIR